MRPAIAEQPLTSSSERLGTSAISAAECDIFSVSIVIFMFCFGC